MSALLWEVGLEWDLDRLFCLVEGEAKDAVLMALKREGVKGVLASERER